MSHDRRSWITFLPSRSTDVIFPNFLFHNFPPFFVCELRGWKWKEKFYVLVRNLIIPQQKIFHNLPETNWEFLCTSKGLKREWYEAMKERRKVHMETRKGWSFYDNFFIFVTSREKITESASRKKSTRNCEGNDELRRCYGNEVIFLWIVIKNKQRRKFISIYGEIAKERKKKWIRKIFLWEVWRSCEKLIIDFKPSPVYGSVLDVSLCDPCGNFIFICLAFDSSQTVLIHIETLNRKKSFNQLMETKFCSPMMRKQMFSTLL
jgi:hypothetical protein